MEEFINRYGVQIIINEGGDVYLKCDLDSETDIELTFDSVQEAEKKLGEDLENISEMEMIDYQNDEELNYELEDYDID